MKLYKLDNGEFSPYPETREKAIKHKSPRYDGINRCTDCGRKSPKFVTTDNCMMCQRMKMDRARHIYTHGVGVEYPEKAPQPARDVEWDDEINDMVNLLKTTNVIMGDHPCKKHGHVGLLDEFRNCYQCKDLDSPLKQAKLDGRQWYIPSNKCSGCGEICERHVTTSECKSCSYKPSGVPTFDQGDTDRRETPDSAMMRNEPDMVISRQESIEYGFKVYRTGKPCKNDHTGWRYVSTNNCINCLRGK